MFINFSNHPSDKWSPEQINAAHEYGEIVDFPFPNVDESWDAEKMTEEIEKNGNSIIELKPDAVMCQGEYVMTFGVVRLLKRHGIKCLSAVTKRITVETTLPDGSVEKRSVFKFHSFREYLG